jgi:hypothetical protein
MVIQDWWHSHRLAADCVYHLHSISESAGGESFNYVADYDDMAKKCDEVRCKPLGYLRAANLIPAVGNSQSLSDTIFIVEKVKKVNQGSWRRSRRSRRRLSR